MENFYIEEIHEPEIESLPVEIVERKGLGHPDTICDAIAENVSIALSQYYLEKFGKIFHHNIDKVLLVGGQALPKFGAGVLLQPLRIIVSGRVTTEVVKNSQKFQIPFGTIIKSSVRKWFRENFRFLNPDLHTIIDYKVGPGSWDLRCLGEEFEEVPLANDTSVGIGFAPLSTLENLVYKIEHFLNSKEFKHQHPAVGEDVKVLGLRRGRKITLIIASAIVSKYILTSQMYVSLKEEITEEILQKAKQIVPDYEVEVFLNTGDCYEKNIYYITVTGTSAEQGDDGATGRGNRVNGLITPFRPMTIEATAGKNPVNHVGKIYNVVAKNISEIIYQQFSSFGIKEVYTFLLSQMGKPINQPLLTCIKIKMDKKKKLTQELKKEIFKLAKEKIQNIKNYTLKILDKEFTLF